MGKLPFTGSGDQLRDEPVGGGRGDPDRPGAVVALQVRQGRRVVLGDLWQVDVVEDRGGGALWACSTASSGRGGRIRSCPGGRHAWFHVKHIWRGCVAAVRRRREHLPRFFVGRRLG
jgi:hypothetical protein